MYVLKVRNVAEALPRGLDLLSVVGETESSRNGDVLVAPGPVTTVYEKPWERVVFDATRDANPFFHLMESVWMLAGMRDARWLDHYVRDFSARYAEDNGDCHGAYGYRWRQHFEDCANGFAIDQIKEVGEMLAVDPTSRRCVIAMWDPAADLDTQKKDLPCNTHMYFRVVRGKLDVTVCNRSNDIVWGAYGANAVHMSIVAEVIAGLAGLQLGHYYQISNNFHAYADVYRKMQPMMDRWYDGLPSQRQHPITPIITGEAQSERTSCAENILIDAQHFVEMRDHAALDGVHFYTSWFREEIMFAHNAHMLWKLGKRDQAVEFAHKIATTDWQIACLEWMQRRMIG